MDALAACIRRIVPIPGSRAQAFVGVAFPTAAPHNAPMQSFITFLGFGVAAWALWKLLRRQEEADPDFERSLQADERRARGNREAAARASLEHDEAVKAQRAAQGTTPPTPPGES